MIYLVLKGRIGNQLFMYAAAREVQFLKGKEETIVIDDTAIGREDYVNSLKMYDLPNVVYVSDMNGALDRNAKIKEFYIKIYQRLTLHWSYRKREQYERKHQRIWNRMGMFIFENGFCQYPEFFTKKFLMRGYFQSEKYFAHVSQEIREIYRLQDEKISLYPNRKRIEERNTVCISIKIEHNIGNEVYDVCTKRYWEKAVAYIIENVDDPLFFICSDNVQYVKEHLIDCNKYDIIEQDMKQPVQLSLAVMARCKHFIIGNTSFGWWAQYLSDYDSKIVVAPSRWYGVDIPCDIYQDNWKVIEV